MKVPEFDYLIRDLAILKCPRCGGNDMHHGKVEVFYREREDDEFEMATIADKGVTTTTRVPSKISNNPSSRRDGLTIEFYCEHCVANGDGEIGTITLTIAQNKGWTHFEWR